MEDGSGQLKDYKFFCFDGKVKCFKIDFDRETIHHANYYDRQGRLLPFGESICPPDNNRSIEMPKQLEKMISLSEELSKGIDFLRVDFYSILDEELKFGELTFFPASGFGKFDPAEWDEKLGEWLELSENMGGVLEVKVKRRYVNCLKDYKFYCFNGKPQFLYISEGLENHDTAKLGFVSMDWEKAPFRRNDYKDFDVLPNKPKKFDDMKMLAAKLSSNVSFLRVDFYEINGKIYFGELTFYPSSGFVNFYPEEYDERLGELLELPVQKGIS